MNFIRNPQKANVNDFVDISKEGKMNFNGISRESFVSKYA